MKKLVLILLSLFLFGCGVKEPVIEEKDEFIKPYKEEEVFQYLNKETYDLLYRANGGVEIETYALSKLGEELSDFTLTDYYGEKINLKDYKDKKLVIELSAYWCSHCKEQSHLYTDEIMENYKDIVFIQYFNEGDNKGIDSFYKEIGQSIPDNIIVIPYDKEFSAYILNKFNPKYYPSFLVFDEGVLTYVKASSLSKEDVDKAYDVMFNKALDLNMLTDEEGKSVFEYTRDKEAVKNDLSEENYRKLLSLDNDEYTKNLTLEIIGKEFNFYDQLEDDSTFKSEVDFTAYDDKDLVIFSLYKPEEEMVKLINDCYKENSDIEIIVMDVADEYTKEMSLKLEPKVFSIMNQVPKILNDINFITYPSCIFIKKGTLTGAYSNVLSVEMFNKAKEIFLSGNSIALLKNN